MAKKSSNKQSERLFEEKLVPAKVGSGELFDVSYDEKPKPVECLGMTFPNDEARRAHFTNILREKLKDPVFRKIEGFPIGEDEDILALSDPPYYTACPNPFLQDYLAHVTKGRSTSISYSRLPYPAALEDSRNNGFVNAHSYATKVPHESVMRLVLHYTEPGDVILDGFVGTGMTAVGIQMCADLSAVKNLGYSVDPKTFAVKDKGGSPFSRVGNRYAIVSDLCPAATHLCYNFNFLFDEDAFEREVDEIVSAVEKECGWMYQTRHGKNGVGEVVCVLWSDVFVCNNCNKEIVFWEGAVDLKNNEVSDLVTCSHCKAAAKKSSLERSWSSVFDPVLKQPVRQAKQVPGTIVYEADGVRHEKTPDEEDYRKLKRIADGNIPYWYPTIRMPDGEESRRNDPLGLTHIHHFFTKRNLWALSCAWTHARSWRAKFMLTSLMYKSSKLCAPLMSNYFASRKGVSRGGWVGKERSGTLYCPSIQSEVSILSQIATRRRAVRITAASKALPIMGVASVTQIGLPNESIDYIFTDPPFGGNKMYSELAFMWESWLKVFTNNKCEAIKNKVQEKGLADYESLMARGFEEYYRVLKPGRWITVEFSNTEAAVWNALQNAIGKAGFLIADVRDLHKQQGSLLGYTTTTATRQDLAISAYKPDARLEEQFRLKPGDESGIWSFVRSHLKHLQVADVQGEKMNLIAERQGYVLFDRLVGFNVQRGYPVPISSSEFHVGLRQKFPERDGMYFLPDQVAEYEQQRLAAKSFEQLSLFVSDEKSAIQWVRQKLAENPMTYQELQPQFFTEAQRVWESHEKRLELQTILDQNFVKETDGKWQNPDPKNEAHLEQLRNRDLLREFQQYLEAKGKLKVVRTEALRAGFKECWQNKDYTTIVNMAKRLPDAIIQEDQALLMYFDNASLLKGE
jgi:hypothetical protein